MWNFFKKEQKKTTKKKPIKKRTKKPVSKKNKASDPLDILDRTLDKKLKEMQEHKKILEKENDKVEIKSVSDKKAHINKPADINFTQKKPKTYEDTNTTVTSTQKKIVHEDHSHFIQVLNDTIQDIDSGVLFAGLTELKTKQILKQTLNDIYDISQFNDFINQFLDLTENKHAKTPFLLIDLDKNVFLYLQIFEQHYYVILLDKNELSLGHVLNILKPELIKNYRIALKKIKIT